MTHQYFIAKARARFYELGGDPDNSGPLAEWAEEAKRLDDPARGVIVAEDGELIAQTRYHHGGAGRPGAVYVTEADAQRWGLHATECDLAKGQLAALTGKRVVHVTMPEVCHGAGQFVPEVPSGPPDPLAKVTRAAAKRAETEDALRQAVRDAYSLGANPTDLARAADVSRPTIYRWLAAAGFQTSGFKASGDE